MRDTYFLEAGNVWGFPGSSDGKESACNVGDLGLISGLGTYPVYETAKETLMYRTVLWAL